MKFDLQDDHVDVRDLATEIFGDLATLDRVVQVESEEQGFDRHLWSVLAEAGMLEIALPHSAGGAGLGMLGLVAIVEQQGRRVAAVPLCSVVAGAALPIAQFGTAEQIERWLPGVRDGSRIVTSSFETLPGEQAIVAGRVENNQLIISGEIPHVAAASVASAMVVPVGLANGEVQVAIVSTQAAGLTLTPVSVTSHENVAAARFDDVAVGADDLLPGDGAMIAGWVRARVRVGLAALQVGVCAEALRITADYTSERVQFGRPISTNQAVAMRAADAYLDTEAMRLTAYKAAWLLDTGAEEAAMSAAMVAKWWAASGGLRVVLAGQHLHGGIGGDIEYPIHRYFLWGRQIAFSLGSADALAAELGQALESAPAIGASS